MIGRASRAAGLLGGLAVLAITLLISLDVALRFFLNRPLLFVDEVASFLQLLVVFGGLAWMLSSWNGFQTSPAPISERFDSLRQLGLALVSPDAFVLPFELASVLLLAAMIGALVIAWERK